MAGGSEAEAAEFRARSIQPIAMVGIATRLPGAAGPAEFLALLRKGVDAVGAAPADRP